MQDFHYINISDIPWLQIAQRLGYPNFESVQNREKQLLEEILKKILSVWEPKGTLKNSRILNFKDDKIICEEIEIPSKNLVQIFKNSHKITALLVTAGSKAVEYKEQLLKNNELTKATLADAILSELTDALADELNRFVLRQASLNGFKLTMRFSPGYGDLALNFQKNLLDFLDSNKFQVTLTENYIMIPEKSVTALIGWKK